MIHRANKPVAQFVYWLGSDDYDLTVSPSKDDDRKLIVTHSHSGRFLLSVPPTVPTSDLWTNIAGAALNDWMWECGKTEARKKLQAISEPLPIPSQGRMRTYFMRLALSISSFFSRLIRALTSGN